MKKQLKKLFSKLTVLVLLVSILAPSVIIPKAEAETNKCQEGEKPEYHVNYYFFLHAETPFSWLEMFSKEKVTKDETKKNNTTNSLTTDYYTEFLYTFPTDGSKIVFEDEGFVKITNSSDVNQNFNAGTEQYREAWTAGQFYNELGGLNAMKNYSEHQAYSQYAYQKGGTENNDEDNRVVTYLFHGNWAHVGEQTTKGSEYYVDLNHLEIKDHSAGIEGTIEEKTAATVFITPNDASLKHVNIGTPILSGGYKIDREEMKEGIIQFNESKKTGVVATSDVDGRNLSEPVLNLAIRRTYQLSDLVDTSKVTNITLSKDSTTPEENAEKLSLASGLIKGTYNGVESILWLPEKEGQSVSAITSGSIGEVVGLQKTVKGKDTYWFVAPALYQMSYYVCKDADTASEDEVTLSYNENKPSGVTANVSGMPENQKKAKGSEFTISDKKPELSGYKFKEWNLSKNCDNKGFEPGYKIEKLNENTPLYACWASTSTTNNGKTGVLTYTGLFAGIIALAGGSYYLIKKKNLFKKI